MVSTPSRQMIKPRWQPTTAAGPYSSAVARLVGLKKGQLAR